MTTEPHLFERVAALTGWKDADLAEILGIGRSTVQAVRSGEDGDIPALGYFSGLAQLPGNDREALAACMTNGGGRVSSEELAAISCPVLVVLGEHDFVQPADRLIDSLANARLVTLPRTDHARTPKSFEFIDAALDFLRVRG